MKKYSLGDYSLYYLARLVSFIFRLLPIPLVFFIARRLGEASMYLNMKRRRIAYANLKSAFLGQYSPKELKRILRKTYANIGQGLLEVFLLPKVDKAYIERFISFENFQYSKEALKRGKGLMFLTAHFGTWEMSQAALPYMGYAVVSIAREQKPYLLNQLLNSYRESRGCKIIFKGLAVKEAFKTLKSNGVVGMLVDQDAGKDGVFVKLFGKEASWNRGIMEIAYKTGAIIVPGFAIREKGPSVRFKLSEPIDLSIYDNKEEAIIEGFKRYSSILEGVIRDNPDQWLWQHRRWKSSPVRDVLILNDGRTGHLRQSEAVLNILRNIWQKKGYKREDIRSKVIDISFKGPFLRKVLAFGGNFSGSFCMGCVGCVRSCLKKESSEALIGSYADIVISCGSSIAPLNAIISKENNAKSILIMKPPMPGLKKFNLAIVPKHDNPPLLKNVLITDGALNLIDQDRMDECKKVIMSRISDLRSKVIGILLGGSAKGYSMDPDTIGRLIDGILDSAKENDCDIIITTSRRTPAKVEELLKAKLSNDNRCKLLIIANENNLKGAIEGILSISDLVVVSQESISMISESATSGKHTVVFQQSKCYNKRHQLFLENLKDKNHIELVSTKEISSVISDFYKSGSKQTVLNDSGKVEEALERLL
ncbi:ELM1/GtrOC1 family putative glycosyltransferase [Candidatus Omnitrophota bacterium]